MLENISFTKAVRNTLVEGPPLLFSSVVRRFYGSGLTVEMHAPGILVLEFMGMIEFQNRRQVSVLIRQRKGRSSYQNGLQYYKVCDLDSWSGVMAET